MNQTLKHLLALAMLLLYGALAAVIAGPVQSGSTIKDFQKRDLKTGNPAIQTTHDNGDGTVTLIVQAVIVTPTPSATNTPTPTATATATPTS